MTTHRKDAEKVSGWASLGRYDYMGQFMLDFGHARASLADLWNVVKEAPVILPMVEVPCDVRTPHTIQRMHMHTHSTHAHTHTHTNTNTHTHTQHTHTHTLTHTRCW